MTCVNYFTHLNTRKTRTFCFNKNKKPYKSKHISIRKLVPLFFSTRKLLQDQESSMLDREDRKAEKAQRR